MRTLCPCYGLLSQGNDDVEDYAIDVCAVQNLPALFLVTPNSRSRSSSTYQFHQLTNNSHQLLQLYQIIVQEQQQQQQQQLQHHQLFDLQQLFSHLSPSSSSSSQTLRLYVAGDKSSAGKSTISMCLLAALLIAGVPASDLAYIKPATQCEAEQPVTRFCRFANIAHQTVGPVVFYKGFTRAFLAGETESSTMLLKQIQTAVKEVSDGRKFTLIDGVGYPAVGSICGVSNADVAHALNASVLLIGKSGVGDAVDSHNLNSVFFEIQQVPVLGGIFNKLSPDLTQFYNLESCREAVTMYFRKHKPTQTAYGFIPLVHILDDDQTTTTTTTTSSNSTSMFVEPQTVDNDGRTQRLTEVSAWLEASGLRVALLRSFLEHVDTHALVYDLWMQQVRCC